MNLYIAGTLENLSENVMERLAENNYDIYYNNEENRFKKEVTDKPEILEILKILINYEISPGYGLQTVEKYYDFDEHDDWEKNELIKENFGIEFYEFLIESIKVANENIKERRYKIMEIVRELSYDYMMGFNIWCKYGKVRLYINTEKGKAGFIDLINRRDHAEPDFNEFIKELWNDSRIKILSKYFLIKEGYIAHS